MKGRAWKYGDNINTDVIIPARYLNTSNPKELAKHCLEDLDKDFVKKVSAGDIIVAGLNFGSGSSREHAGISIKAAGISCVIAKSFARIFYRNAINIGLPIFESKDAPSQIKGGDLIEVNQIRGIIRNKTTNKSYQIVSFPPFIQEIISAGGLIEYTKQRIEGKDSPQKTEVRSQKLEEL